MSTSAVNLPRQTPWGDRAALLPKQMAYAVSLDLNLRSDGPYVRVHPRASEGPGLRHLFDEAIVITPEGLRVDVPTGEVLTVNGEIGDSADPSAQSLRMKVTVKLGSGSLLNIACDGVVNFTGGPAAFRSPATKTLSGAAFVATRYEGGGTTYRWLERRQLFGVGRLRGERMSGDWVIALSFDLYTAY